MDKPSELIRGAVLAGRAVREGGWYTYFFKHTKRHLCPLDVALAEQTGIPVQMASLNLPGIAEAAARLGIPADIGQYAARLADTGGGDVVAYLEAAGY